MARSYGIFAKRRKPGLEVLGYFGPCSGLQAQTWGVDGSCTWWVGIGSDPIAIDLERDKGIRWMPWHQEAMKDVARCEKPWGAASRR